jgi:transmembrane sensor
MPLDKEHIERLILEELSGVISPEDSAVLQKMVEEDPEVWAIRENFRQQLTNPEISAAREDFLSTFPPEQLVHRIKKEKTSRIYQAVGLSIAASVTILLMVYLPKQPDITRKSPVSLHSSTLKSVALQLPGTPSVDLGSPQQQINIGDITFHGESDHLYWTGTTKAGSIPATIKVPKGVNYTVILPDGSEIRLNEESDMQFPVAFNHQTRDITIHGEAYLKIAPDPDKPFLVHLPHGTVHVLGTEFNVNTRNDQQVKVALATGAVKVVTAADTLTLKPRQIVSYEEGKPLRAESFGRNNPFYWKDTYPFRDAKIHDIGIKVGQLYGLNVIIEGKNTGNQTLTITIDHNQSLQYFLDELKHKTNLDYSLEKGNNILHIKSLQ